MIDSKQRAKLRSMAANLDTILQIGKSGMNDNLIKQVDDALTARELIKLRVLETSPESNEELADELAENTGAEIVQIIGNRIVLFRVSPDEKKRKIIV